MPIPVNVSKSKELNLFTMVCKLYCFQRLSLYIFTSVSNAFRGNHPVPYQFTSPLHQDYGSDMLDQQLRN